MLIDEDIDAIIQKGEEKTQALYSKYEGLNLDDLANFKSDMAAQQWEGENFSNKPKGNLVWIEPAKRQASRGNPNYSVDQYYQAAMRVGPPKVDKGPKLAKAPKHITMCVGSGSEPQCASTDPIRSICLATNITSTLLD
jgi:SWI/SNF-related matrix-associated actin-dependent regulator of chromatin subfamily A member 5